ncbi:dipeptide ABC transporter ATP-binding protein [Arthrobacter sp. ISL-30]|uniref:ABC transporter ATP-binding protein n=1 Tax=Arthrobacter sp. ISL-30 TaxID=2819109 RepID=UPI001BEA21F2|nr:ABC transporter ATP-binding protein [Arthrobacter sp. ISL-30]
MSENLAAAAVRRCPPRDETPVLAIRDLSVSFGIGGHQVQAIKDVSFDVYRGEILAVVGESGSGKSVSSLAALRLLPDTADVSGSVTTAGLSVLTASEAEMEALRGDSASMIFQEPMTAMNPVYTIGQQIGAALRAHRPVSRKEAQSRTIEMLELVGMPEPERRVNQYPHQLSGGQRQRAMIAMALICEPQLLIADEPTTALDVTVQAEILDLIKDIQKKTGMAVVFITHDMGVVADIADRVIVMQKGMVVEEAFVNELFDEPRHPYSRKLLAAVPRLTVTPQPAGNVTAGLSDEPQERRDVVLSAKDLVIEYPGRLGRRGFRAVEKVSFEIRRGEILGLVGESGSGKSTVGRCAVGLLQATEGELNVCGHDISRLSARNIRPLRKRFGIVFQDPASSLNPRASIGDSIAEPLRLHGPRSSAGDIRKKVRELLESVELPGSWYERYPHELSGGQRQRIGIARAISLEPELLVADEPTSALDVSVQAKVLEILVELQRRMGFSCLFISHDLAVVESLASNVAVMRKGSIVETGSISQVLHQPQEAYTKRLIAAAPIPDPREQRRRTLARQAAAQEDRIAS